MGYSNVWGGWGGSQTPIIAVSDTKLGDTKLGCLIYLGVSDTKILNIVSEPA